MAEVRSDNRLEQHPKPTQEYERRFTGTTWVDWVDTAELEAVYNVAYRPNKYFWINGDYFECLSDGVTYRKITGGGGGSGTVQIATYLPTGASNTIIVPELSGHTFYIAIMATQSFDTTHVSQSGTTLDFVNVGGVINGVLITILFV